jgi:hypothetical protein
MPWIYPRWIKRPPPEKWKGVRFRRSHDYEEKHFRSVRRAARKYATLVGRRGKQPVWALKEPRT